MAKLPKHISELAKKYNVPNDDFWDCQGTWVIKHTALEKIAGILNIIWHKPTIIKDDTKLDVVVLATGELEGRVEWSFGEASLNNYAQKKKKNTDFELPRYPWAFAEKRAKDRVIIKLAGLHGLYSEDEADDFQDAKPSSTKQTPTQKPAMSKAESRLPFKDLQDGMRSASISGLAELQVWGKNNVDRVKQLPSDWAQELRDEYQQLLNEHKETQEAS